MTLALLTLALLTLALLTLALLTLALLTLALGFLTLALFAGLPLLAGALAPLAGPLRAALTGLSRGFRSFVPSLGGLLARLVPLARLDL